MATTLSKMYQTAKSIANNVAYYGSLSLIALGAISHANFYVQDRMKEVSAQELRVEKDHNVEIQGDPSIDELIVLNEELDNLNVQGPLAIRFAPENPLQRTTVDNGSSILNTASGIYSNLLGNKAVSLITRPASRKVMAHELGHYLTRTNPNIKQLEEQWSILTKEGDEDKSPTYDCPRIARLTFGAQNLITRGLRQLGIEMHTSIPEDALNERGYFSDYSTTSYLEDMAEVIAHYEVYGFNEFTDKASKSFSLIDKIQSLSEAGVIPLTPRLMYRHLLESELGQLHFDVDDRYHPKEDNLIPESYTNSLKRTLTKIDHFIKSFPDSPEAQRLKEFRPYVSDPNNFLSQWDEKGEEFLVRLKEIDPLDCSKFTEPRSRILLHRTPGNYN